MSGELATQTPPWPTAMPEGMFSPSAKTVTLSTLPSPSVSSRTLIAIASRAGGVPRIFEALGDPDAAPLVERHGDRVDDVGLGGDQLDLKPSGTFMLAIASAGDSAGPGGRVCPCGI